MIIHKLQYLNNELINYYYEFKHVSDPLKLVMSSV